MTTKMFYSQLVTSLLTVSKNPLVISINVNCSVTTSEFFTVRKYSLINWCYSSFISAAPLSTSDHHDWPVTRWGSCCRGFCRCVRPRTSSAAVSVSSLPPQSSSWSQISASRAPSRPPCVVAPGHTDIHDPATTYNNNKYDHNYNNNNDNNNNVYFKA